MSFRAFFPDGQVAKSANFHFESTAPSALSSGASDADGVFVLEGAPTTSFGVVARSRHGFEGSKQVPPGADSAAIFRVDLTRRKLPDMQLVGTLGDDLEGWRLMYHEDQVASSAIVRSRVLAVSDEDGRAWLRSVDRRDGLYSLWSPQADLLFPFVTFRAELSNGETTSVELRDGTSVGTLELRISDSRPSTSYLTAELMAHETGRVVLVSISRHEGARTLRIPFGHYSVRLSPGDEASPREWEHIAVGAAETTVDL